MLPKQIPKTLTEWRVSSYSDNGSNCVEVQLADQVGVRDTKDRAGGTLAVTDAAWRALTATIRD